MLAHKDSEIFYNENGTLISDTQEDNSLPTTTNNFLSNENENETINTSANASKSPNDFDNDISTYNNSVNEVD